MSTASTPRPLSPDDLPPPDDPYLYGWRIVRHVRPDGTEFTEQVPLTRLDVLHPREGDVIVGCGGHHVESIDQLHRVLTEDRIGVSTPLVVIRGTEKLEIDITPGLH